MIKLGPQITVFYEYREHDLGIINFLSSLAVCGAHAITVLLFRGMSYVSDALFRC